MRWIVRSVAALAAPLALLAMAAAPAVAVRHVGGCAIRPETQCAGHDLYGADLRGADLSKANLSGADLRRADLTGANLYDANLIGAHLTKAKLIDARARHLHVRGVVMHEADLSDGDFERANFSGSQLDAATLTDATLQHATAEGTNFAHAELKGVNAANLKAQGANFYGTHLTDTDFYAANVQDTHFHGAYFNNTRFLGAHITGASVTPSTINDDPVARYYFFDKVYAHVNAYGSSGSCTGSGSAEHQSMDCSGRNDDPNATHGFGWGVRIDFGWGSRQVGGRRGFDIIGSYGGSPVELRGTADIGLSEFRVSHTKGLYNVLKTPDPVVAPRGLPGGPVRLHVAHTGGITNTYVLNFFGWIQRTGTAPTGGAPG